MSAFMVTETHIRALVSAMEIAERRHCARFPPIPASFVQIAPEAFPHALARPGMALDVSCYEDEAGRALWLANMLALAARYPDPEKPEADALAVHYAEALGYRHALVEQPPVAIIKQAQCWAYQCAEDNEDAREWARAVCEAVIEAYIPRLPGYDAAPWGLKDPTGGAPAPGTAGAPVSLLSLVKKG